MDLSHHSEVLLLQMNHKNESIATEINVSISDYYFWDVGKAYLLCKWKSSERGKNRTNRHHEGHWNKHELDLTEYSCVAYPQAPPKNTSRESTGRRIPIKICRPHENVDPANAVAKYVRCNMHIKLNRRTSGI